MKRLAGTLAIVLIAGVVGAPAPAADGPEQVGKTIVRVDRGDAVSILSWQDMADYHQKSRWISLDTVVAPSKGPVPLRRGAIALVLPDGARVPLATAERYHATAGERKRPPRYNTRGGAEMRDPLQGLYRKAPESTTGVGTAWVCPSFWTKGLDGAIPEEISPEAWKPFRGYLWFESPASWPEGSYVLDLGVPGLELPFTLPPSKS